jgi:hypothetical protein
LQAQPPLPGGLVEEHAGGDGDVQGIHVARHGDLHHVITRGERSIRQAGTLRAEHQAAVVTQIHRGEFLGVGPWMRGQATDTARAQGAQGLREIVYVHHRLFKDRAHRAGHGATLEGAATRLAHDEDMHAKGGAVAHDGSQVFRASNAFDGGEQPWTRGILQERFKVRQRRDLGHSQRALMHLVTRDGFQQRRVREIDVDGFRAGAELGFQLCEPRGREQGGDDRVTAGEQASDDLMVRGHEHAGPFVFLHAAQGAIQCQFRRVEVLNGLEKRNGHPELNRAPAAIKSANPTGR